MKISLDNRYDVIDNEIEVDYYYSFERTKGMSLNDYIKMREKIEEEIDANLYAQAHKRSSEAV